MLACIACVDKNFAIGYQNQLLYHISNDMYFFKTTTMEHTVVMGRKTFESMNYKPLKNRTNIVITSKMDLKNLAHDSSDDLFIVGIDDARHLIRDYLKSGEDIYIIGGQKIYETFIDECDTLYLTQVNKEAPNADAYFPDPYKHNFINVRTIQEGCSDIITNTKYQINKWVKIKK